MAEQTGIQTPGVAKYFIKKLAVNEPVTMFCLPGSDPMSHEPKTVPLEETVAQYEERALS